MKKGFIVPLILLGTVSILLVLWFYFNGRYTKISDKKFLKEESFQQSLTDKCEIIRADNAIEQIQLADLPININTAVIKIDYNSDPANPITFPIICEHAYEGINDRYVVINNTLDEQIVIYDHRSNWSTGGATLGQGTISVDGANNVDSSKNDKVVDILLGLEDNYSGEFIVGEVPIIISGKKWIEINNGGVVFVNVRRNGIPKDDARLIKILQNYSEPSQKIPGTRKITRVHEAQLAIWDTFFRSDQIGNPEKENMQMVNDSLDAFTKR